MRPRNYQTGYQMSTALKDLPSPQKDRLVSNAITGVNLRDKPSKIEDTELSYALNARFQRGTVSPKPGLTLVDSTSFDGTIMLIDEFVLSSGVRYKIVITTQSIYISTNLVTFTKLYWYTHGKAATTPGSPIVVGSGGTAWLTNVKAGDKFKIDSNGVWYPVLSVQSNTRLTLTTPFIPNIPQATAYTIDRPFTGTDQNIFWGLTITDDDYYVFCQGVDPVYYIDSSVNLVHRLSTDCPAAKHGMLFADRLVIGNLADDTLSPSTAPFRMRWCMSGGYTDWTGVGSGYKDWVEDSYPITGLSVQLGTGVVYKEKSISHMTRTGRADSAFSFATRVPSTGAYYANSLVSTPLGDMFIGEDDFYAYDLRGDPKPIGLKIKDVFFNSSDPGRREVARSLAIKELNEVQFFFCESGTTTPSRVISYNWLTDSWQGFWDWKVNSVGRVSQYASKTWADLIGSWANWLGAWGDTQTLASQAINLIGIGSSLYKEDPSVSQDSGVNFLFDIRGKELKSQEPKQISCYRVILDYYTIVGATVYISLSGDGGVVWSTIISKALDSTNTSKLKRAFFDFILTYNQIIVRIQSTGGYWELVNVSVEAVPSGEILES
jgi:hypothetical protein